MHILSRLLAGEGYERVVRAVGVDTWHEIVDNYLALPTSHSPVVCQWKAAIGVAILEHEDMERCLRILDGLRHCLARGFSQDFGEASGDAEEAGAQLSTKRCRLRHAAKILECCASTDSRTGEGWTILHALASAGEGDDEKTVSIVNLIHAQQHVLVAALQHPSMNVRLAALRCASKVVAAASFPRTDRLAMMDVLVRCLRDMREEAQAAAVPHPGKPREDDYSDEFEAVATLWRFDEGEDRWTGGAKGTVKVLTHRLLADNLLFIFRDANGKLMAYHPFTPDTQLVKVDDVTWEWRAEKDYADDDEGFAEQFRLSLQSSERAADFNITSHDQIASSRRHQALLHRRRHQEWLWKMNSSLLQKKRSGATRSPHGKHSSMLSSAPPSTAPRRTSSAPQVMTGRSSTKSIASQPSRRFVLGARVMSHRSRWRVAPPRNASLTTEARWKLLSSLSRATTQFRMRLPVAMGWRKAYVTPSSKVGCCVMTIIQKHVRPGAIREALGEDLHTSIAALVTLINSTSTLRN
jgi:Ran-binding protein 1